MTGPVAMPIRTASSTPGCLGTAAFRSAIASTSQPLEADQLTTEFFETIVIKSEAELDTTIGDAALGNEAPDDLLQDLLKVHASAPVRRDLRPCSRIVALAPKAP